MSLPIPNAPAPGFTLRAGLLGDLLPEGKCLPVKPPPVQRRTGIHFLSSSILQGVALAAGPGSHGAAMPLLPWDLKRDALALWDSVSPVVNEGGTGRISKADISFSTTLSSSQKSPAHTGDEGGVGAADSVL